MKSKYSLLPITYFWPWRHSLHVCEIMGFTIEDKHLIKCLRVISSNEYLILTSMECLITHKQTLKILCKSKHFSRRYKRKREWVFFFLNTVYDSRSSTISNTLGMRTAKLQSRLTSVTQRILYYFCRFSGIDKLLITSFKVCFKPNTHRRRDSIACVHWALLAHLRLYRWRQIVKGAITSKIKYAIKHNTSPARLA